MCDVAILHLIHLLLVVQYFFTTIYAILGVIVSGASLECHGVLLGTYLAFCRLLVGLGTANPPQHHDPLGTLQSLLGSKTPSRV
jgi:hypothetical protein